MKIWELVVDKVKELPGVGYVLFCVTWIGAKLMGVDELAGIPLIAAGAVCAGAYFLGSKLDTPLYDSLYGPNAKLSWLPKHRALTMARDAAAKSLYGGQRSEVEVYADATRLGYVTETSNMYDTAKSVVKTSSEWEDHIVRIHDLSKAARSLFVVAFAALCLFVIAALLPSSPGISNVAEAAGKAGWVGSRILYAIALPVAFGIYVYLRAVHQIRLYQYLANNVRLVRTEDGQFVPFLPSSRLLLRAPNDR